VNARSKVDARPLLLGLVSIIASGCAAGISSHPHGRGAGEWSVSLPAAASYSQGLAYGRGGSAARVQDDSATPLFAEAYTPAAADEQPRRKPVQRKRRADQAPPVSAPATPQQPQPAPAPARSMRTEVADAGLQAPQERTELAMADASMLGRYESRQAQSQTQQEFKGGDAIVIGASTLVIVLLIVLLVLLLV
jgi:cobalamin biosynthesis Mg chelatase CobN